MNDESTRKIVEKMLAEGRGKVTGEARLPVTPELVESVSEKDFMQAIIDEAKRLGWLVYHTYDSRKSEAGFPDLVLVRGSDLLFLECKTGKGRLTAAQLNWIESLDLVTKIEAMVVRPSGWDVVLNILKGSEA